MRARVVTVLATMVAASVLCLAPWSGGAQRAALANFDPFSVSFSSPTRGWALGTLPCAAKKACVELLRTTDGGTSWAKQALSTSLAKEVDRSVHGTAGTFYGLNVRFANRRDGWIFGMVPVTVHTRHETYETWGARLWSTHDGAATWTRVTLPGAAVIGVDVSDVQANRTTVFAMAQNSRAAAIVYRSPIGKDRWRKDNDVALNPPAGGAQPGGAIVLKGASGWLVYGNDRGTTGSARLAADGTWVAWRAPCAALGHGYAVPAAANAHDLVAVCGMGGFAYPMPKTAPRGATIGSAWIYESTNGGASFRAIAEIRPVRDNEAFGDYDGVLAMPRPGEIFVSRRVGDETDLIVTRDNGARWREVLSGDVTYLDFTNVNDGVGLVANSNSTHEMVATDDGGQRWSRVTF